MNDDKPFKPKGFSGTITNSFSSPNIASVEVSRENDRKNVNITLINGQEIPIRDLGKALNEQFKKLHDRYLEELLNRNLGVEFNVNQFINESKRYLNEHKERDKHFEKHDYFFENFTGISQDFTKINRFKEAENLWNLALNIAYEWEEENNSKGIHKGTAYYFAGCTSILGGDLEKGFLLMHQALEEDVLTPSKDAANDSPAHSFVTLDFKDQRPFFYDKVKEIANFLEERLIKYGSEGKGNLNLSELKQKFLELDKLKDTIFVFVYALFRLKRTIEDIDERVTQSVFSSLLQANSIFSLCLILENTIQYKNQNLGTLYNNLVFLSEETDLSLHVNISKKKTILNVIKKDFENNFETTLTQLLKSRYKNNSVSKLTPIEEDLVVAYVLRNYGAHRIESQNYIHKYYEEITSRILYALFYTIEQLY